ncbi:hypothetical protein PG996_000291 [Apiospora saccharicola]|uniref:Uncharacterized protein n=1 Tax=Apiospora saccharicola TaxID=335842 RepID=A0ABR1WDD7_9PEZI
MVSVDTFSTARTCRIRSWSVVARGPGSGAIGAAAFVKTRGGGCGGGAPPSSGPDGRSWAEGAGGGEQQWSSVRFQ